MSKIDDHQPLRWSINFWKDECVGKKAVDNPSTKYWNVFIHEQYMLKTTDPTTSHPNLQHCTRVERPACLESLATRRMQNKINNYYLSHVAP